MASARSVRSTPRVNPPPSPEPASEPLLDRVARLAGTVLGASWAVVAAADGESARAAAVWPGDGVPSPDVSRVLASDALRRALAGARQARKSADPAMPGSSGRASAESRSPLALPVRDGAGAVVGALLLGRGDGRGWTEDERRTAEDLAAAAGAGLELKRRDVQERRLRESVRMLETAVETMQLGVTISGADGRILYTNPADAAMHGYLAHELAGQPSRIFAPHERWEEGRPALGQIRSWTRESENVRRDGTRFPVMLWSDVVLGVDGEPIALVTCSADLSEKVAREAELRETLDALRAARDEMEARVRERTAELNAANESLRREVGRRAGSAAALRESEARFRAVVESVGEGLVLTDAGDVVVYANPQMEQVTGYAPAELQGRVLHRVLAPAGEGEQPDGGRPWPEGTGRWQVPITRRDGSRGWMEVIGSPMRDGDGQVTGVLRAVSDVTAQRLADQELRAVQERLRLLVETVRDYAMVVLDPEGYVVSWNAGAARNTGYTAEEILGRHVEVFYPPEQLDEGRPAGELRAAAAEGRRETEGWRLRRDGSRYWANTVLTALRDEAGRLVGFAEITRDLTDRKEAGEALRRSEEQLRHSQKMEAVGRLAGGIAHDFNNILMAIGGHVQLMLRRVAPDDPARPSLDEVKKGADRAAALTRQLLAFSRRQVLQPRVLDVNAVVGGMQGLLERLIGEDVELVMRLDPRAPRVRADASQIEQVVMNLVVNSRDAMPDGGVIRVDTGAAAVGDEEVARHPYLKPGSYVAITVTDTGVGISAEALQHVFEPFFTTKAPGKGTGLGLSTVYGIVKQSGGFVTAESRRDTYTSFRVYLPPVEEPAEAPAPRAAAAPAAGGSETVLLVEDEPAVRALLAQVLAEAGYRVLQARGGREALALSRRHDGRIDLLLSDVVMPGLGGGELARRLREGHPETRVLFMSGYPSDDVVRHGTEEGGVDLLEKPVMPDVVVARVRAALDRPRGAA
jgi:PAS domain S-box-containing protein